MLVPPKKNIVILVPPYGFERPILVAIVVYSLTSFSQKSPIYILIHHTFINTPEVSLYVCIRPVSSNAL